MTAAPSVKPNSRNVVFDKANVPMIYSKDYRRDKMI